MASSPVTGERTSGFRRSSSQFTTLPQRELSFHERAAPVDDDATAHVLYTHANVRIYTFQPPTDALENLDKTKKTLVDADYPIDAIEILPWRSRTETLSAKGKLVVEKVSGSAHFIKAGSLVYSVLKNSQCWCVDGQSKFVMRIGRLRYLRMEFPASEDHEKQSVEEFKKVLAKIMKYETTPCPFIRAFKVDLPDDAITPRRKGTWKRKESTTPATPDSVAPFGSRLKSSRAMSMRGMPPTSFPSRSRTGLDSDRPRTASTPISTDRFSFGDSRSESPVAYGSGEEATDSDRPESSHHSEAEDSDRERHAVPLIKSPLNNVETVPPSQTRRISSSSERPQRPSVTFGRRSSTVGDQIKAFERFQFEPQATPVRRAESQTRTQPAEQADPSPRATTEAISSTPATTPDLTDMSPSAGAPQRDTSANTHVAKRQHEEEPLTDNDSLFRTLVEECKSPRPGGSDSGYSEPSSDEPPPDYGTMPDPEHSKAISAALARHLSHQHAQTGAPIDLPSSEGSASLPGVATASEFAVADREDADKKTSEGHNDADMDGGSAPATRQDLKGDQALEQKTEDQPNSDPHELVRTCTNDDARSTISTDSFHTLLSDEDLDSKLVPFPESFNIRRPSQHRRELSEMTVTAASMAFEAEEANDAEGAASDTPKRQPLHPLETSELPRTPGAFTEDTSSELRQRLRHRRSLSPLPPSAVLRQSSPTEQKSQISAALLQKAATFAVVKPIEVAMLIVHVLVRIAGGATVSDLMSGDLFRRPSVPRRTASGTFERHVEIQKQRRRGRSVPSGLDISEDEYEDEDDYGNPVHNRPRTSDSLD